MSEQQFFVSRGRTIRGPVTNRKKIVRNGRTEFLGQPGMVYRADDGPLPAGYVEYAKGKKETNGQTLLQNLIEDGSIVFEAGGQSPIQFAPAMKSELVAAGGVIREDK